MKDQLWDLKTLGANDVSEMTYKYCVKCDIKHYSLPLIGLLLLLKGSVMMTRFQLFCCILRLIILQIDQHC